MDESKTDNRSHANLKQKFSNEGKSTKNVNLQAKRHKTSLVGKTVSCSELPSSCLKTYSYSNLESNSLFFNEKGWPVKVMRVTETSSPKAIKPYPTRSLPSTSVSGSNSAVRKEKSIFTQNKKIITKLCKEDKENSTRCIKESEKSTLEHIHEPVEQVQEKKVELVDRPETDLKSMLDNLDKTLHNISSENPTIDLDKGKKEPVKESATKKSTYKPIKKPPKVEKNENQCTRDSARSNKYNSGEMKAYIQAKRSERKLQLSEEVKKKQAMMEMQKKNLEKLKEKASKVLKKSSTKTVEENKPRWQGPLGDDNSDSSSPAIHIFESKIPTSKSKLSVKQESNETIFQLSEKQEMNNDPAIKEDKDDNKNVNQEFHVEKLSNKETNSLKMEKENSDKCTESSRSTKLRLSRNKFPKHDPRLVSAMEKAATEHGSQWRTDLDSFRENIDQLTQSRKLTNGSNNDQIDLNEFNTLLPVTNDRRATFDVSHHSKEESLKLSETRLRKRPQTSPVMYNDISKKNIVDKESDKPQYGSTVCRESIEDALKKIQEQIISNQKEGKDKEWLNTFIKPDGFSMMNVIKMKRLSDKKRHNSESVKRDKPIPKVTSTRLSLGDETDATSITSMEEDFRIPPEPLRLSEICLPVPTTTSASTADCTPHLSVGISQSNKKLTDDSMKTSVSSFASEAPPLIVPDYVQHLKLKSRRTLSELSSSVSLDLQTFSELPTSDRTFISLPADKRLRASPAQLSSSNTASYKKVSSQQAEDVKVRSHPTSDGQIEIGQVLSSAALLLQFHAELNRLDAFDQSLAQVIAAERLYHTPTMPCGQTRVMSADSSSTSVRSIPLRMAHSTPSLDTQQANQQNQASAAMSPLSSRNAFNSKGNSTQTISEQLPSPGSASELGRQSSLQSVEELCSNQEIVNEKLKEVFQIQRPITSSLTTISASISSYKSLQLNKMLIEDALFQKEQYDLLLRTQEDVLQANYKAAIADLDLKDRNIPSILRVESTGKDMEVRSKMESFYRRARSNIRRARIHANSNWTKRLDDLQKEKEQLEKQMKNKRYKLKSAEASPKKLIALRSSSASSIVENSSSSESSLMSQHFDDKKRHDSDKLLVLNRKKLEKEIIKKLYEEEKQKVQEIEKVQRSLRTVVGAGRSRRDKSTSPLQTVEETSTRDVACSVQEDIQSTSHQPTSSSLQSVEEARGTDVYNSESFESPESSETPRQPKLINRPFAANKPFITAHFNSKSKMLIKVPLSPRMQWCTKRRGSSGSDESVLLSQNETQSEQSDYEVKISALKEQKRQRLMILNRLHRELKKAQKELLKATEASLIKQIQVYDSYIDETKKQLAEVTEEVSAKKIVKPLIKHPRVSDKFLPRVSDSLPKAQVTELDTKQEEVIASDIETNSIKTVSEASSTETTIQSSGQTQITEHLSPKIEINNEEISNAALHSVLQTDSRVSEALSNVDAEASNAPGVESADSVISEIIEDPSKSVVSSPESAEDESQWVDAEEFFNQLDYVDKVQSISSQDLKIGARNFLTSQENTNSSKNSTSISTNVSNEISFEQNTSVSKEIVNSKTSEPTIEECILPDSSTNDLNKEDKLSNEKLTESRSDQTDVGSVVSIISQAPSPQKHISSNSEILDNLDCEPISTNLSIESDLMSDVDNLSGNGGQTISVADSDKSNILETAFINNSQSLDASISSDINATSQYSTSCVSDGDDVIDLSESGVIKVFVSNKTQVTEKEDNVNQLDKTFIVTENRDNEKDINAKVDTITDFLMNKLLGECLNEKQTKKEVEDRIIECHSSSVVRSTDANSNPPKVENSVDDFTNTVLNKFLKDATDCMFKINESKKLIQFNLNNVSKKIEDKSSPNKLLEALALESSIYLDKGYGDDVVEPEKKQENNVANEVELADGNEGEVFWFDEDLRPVSLQAQREAEELRIKQLQIEQEIKQLEQAQENIPSYYYVREIPNKPPPPYTPPQPTRQEDIEGLATVATQILVTTWKRGNSLASMQPPEQYTSKCVGSHMFKKFMFDLVKQILVDITSNDGSEKDCPPWEKTGCRLRNRVLPELTEESVKCFIMKRVRVLFGFEPNFIKENLIIQWSRKKRDRVDELLVRESQEEEQEWTDYSKYEVAVKNSVALSIFDSLLEETTTALNNAFEKKVTYCQQFS